jgi:hypothetical protein
MLSGGDASGANWMIGLLVVAGAGGIPLIRLLTIGQTTALRRVFCTGAPTQNLAVG